MATIQAVQQLANAVAGMTPQQKKDEMCKAFRDAVDDYCKASPAERKAKKNFNNFFYDRLRAQNSQLAGAIAREVPIVATGAGANIVAGYARALAMAGAPGLLGQVASAMIGGYWGASRTILGVGGAGAGVGISGADAVNIGSNVGVGRMANFAGPGSTNAVGDGINAVYRQGVRPRWLDGVIPPRQVIEIKGPDDLKTPDTRQAADQKAFSRPDPPLKLTCSECAPANCVDGKGCTKSNK